LLAQTLEAAAVAVRYLLEEVHGFEGQIDELNAEIRMLRAAYEGLEAQKGLPGGADPETSSLFARAARKAAPLVWAFGLTSISGWALKYGDAQQTPTPVVNIQVTCGDVETVGNGAFDKQGQPIDQPSATWDDGTPVTYEDGTPVRYQDNPEP
jgi:hypothetical protein